MTGYEDADIMRYDKMVVSVDKVEMRVRIVYRMR